MSSSNAATKPTFEILRAQLEARRRPIVLLEGTRTLPDEDSPKLVALAAMLARTFPRAIFRTGNATGSDEAFAQGVASVDSSRLEYVLPYLSHRVALRQPGARSIAVDEEDEALRDMTLQATPHYQALFQRRDQASRAKAKYLMHDTLKVVGSSALALEPAACGVFYVNPQDEMKGGTGHTLRVCQALQVLVATQIEWMTWLT